MPLPSPNLDDRDYAALLEQARAVARRIAPAWDTSAPGDPGMVLVELFAHLSETMLYRFNRIPEKVYVELLRLLGVTVRPPAAAQTCLRFSRSQPGIVEAAIPRGFTVGCGQTDADGRPINFVTTEPVVLAVDQQQVEVRAVQAEWVAGELLGTASGDYAQRFDLARPPVIAPCGCQELIIGVEEDEHFRPEEGDAVIHHDDRYYRIWHEVGSFAVAGSQRYCFVADRMSGRIAFAPAVSAAEAAGDGPAVPTAGRRIRAWYLRGGGRAGNLGPETVNQPVNAIEGIAVTNVEPAFGGQDAESVSAALLRGTSAVRGLERAITATDYEQVALQASSAVDRVKAYTASAQWPSAQPGTVHVRLLPALPSGDERSASSAQDIDRYRSDQVLAAVGRELDARRPLGTRCEVDWVRLKAVSVHATVIIDADHDPVATRLSLERHIADTLAPFVAADGAAWPFGRTLHSSLLYGLIMRQPGVRHIDGMIDMRVDHAPNGRICALAADRRKADTWFAVDEQQVMRSTNDGAGWEPCRAIASGRFIDAALHPRRPGRLAVLVEDGEAAARHWRITVSDDYAESWPAAACYGDFDFEVKTCCWIPWGDEHLLLAATDRGLFRLAAGRSPLRLALGSDDPAHGFWSVAAMEDGAGRCHVVVAAQGAGGIYHSSEGGEAGTFNHIGLDGRNIRSLALQRRGAQVHIWAGMTALGRSNGSGCARYNCANPAAGWTDIGNGWRGGSCNDFVFLADTVLAASHHGGVLELALSQGEPRWEAPAIDCGLPIREDSQEFHPVMRVAAESDDLEAGVLVGGPCGVYRMHREGSRARFSHCSSPVYHDCVTIPEHWLFCSGSHDIQVLCEHAG